MKNLILTIGLMAIVGCGGNPSSRESDPTSKSLPSNPVVSEKTSSEPSNAKYGNAIGNGGNVVACQGKRPVMLDTWELEELAHQKLSLGLAEKPYLEKARFAVERFTEIDEERKKQYLSRIDQFENETVFLKDVELPPIPDALNVAIPKYCTLKQLAIQQKQLTPRDPKYLIDKNLWDTMDNDNKAALVLHETIYREAIDYRQHTDSSLVRKFNGYLLSEEAFTKLDWNTYQELLKNLKMVYWMGQIPTIPLSQRQSELGFRMTIVESGGWATIGKNRFYLYGDIVFSFYGVKHASVIGVRNNYVFIGKNALKSTTDDYYFYDDGSIHKLANYLRDEDDKSLTQSLLVQKEEDFVSFYRGRLVFHPSGSLKCGELAEKVSFYDQTKQLREYFKNENLSFDENGYVLNDFDTVIAHRANGNRGAIHLDCLVTFP